MLKKRIKKQTFILLAGIIMSGVIEPSIEVSAENKNILLEDTYLTRTIQKGKVTTSSLNVRNGSSISASRIGSVKKGTTVEIVGQASNGWYKIKYSNGYGYVSNQYVQVITSNETNNSDGSIVTDTQKKAKVTTASLNVRRESSASSLRIGSVKKGTTVDIVGQASNGWYKIKYLNGYGYISNQYVQVIESGGNTSSDTTNQGVIATGVATIDGVSIRSTNMSTGSYLGSLYTDDKVEIVQKMSNGWYKIKYKNGYAYVANTYIKLDGTNTKPETVINSGKVTTGILNVRSRELTSSSKLGTVKLGQTVQIVGKASNGWYRIQFGSGYGYVSNKYIKINASTTPSTPANRTNLNNFLFIGDSFTYRIRNVIKSNNSNVYIQAQSGSRPSYWLDRVNSMPSNNSVEGVTMLIGVNGVSNTTKNINDTKELINKLIARYPNKKIYIQKVFPVGTGYKESNPSEQNKKISEFNKEIEAFCATKSNVKFIDATSGFVDGNGYLTNTSDGLHIVSSKNATFYKNIFNAIKSAK